jgi:uncharacterized damage-inducible protein DinB
MEGLAAHLEWAGRRTLASLADVPAAEWEGPRPASHGSLAGTAEHLFGTEWTWLERVAGRSPGAVGPEGGMRDRARLEELCPEVWRLWREAASRHDAAEPVRYRTTQGSPHETPFGWILLHVTQHSATYRGQLAAMLRALGRGPATTDLIAFLRARG